MQAAIVSATITLVGLIIGFIQWRRDVQIKLGQIRETVSIELIRLRVEPYTDFLRKLEMSSSIHLENFTDDPKRIEKFFETLQEALYGKVGLLASHETRLVLLYLRSGCKEIMESQGHIPFSELRLRLWALHVALRSDLGIAQPVWKDVVEKIRQVSHDQQTVDELEHSPLWERMDRIYSSRRNVRGNADTKQIK